MRDPLSEILEKCKTSLLAFNDVTLETPKSEFARPGQFAMWFEFQY